MQIHLLIYQLYRSAGSSSPWTAFLTSLCDGMGAHMAVVAASDEQQNLSFFQHAGMDVALQQACAAALLHNTPGQDAVHTTSASVTEDSATGQAAESVSLDRFHRVDVLLGKLPGFSRAGITILRSVENAGFNAAELALVEQLVPHLEGALLLQRQFMYLRQGEDLLDRLSRSFDLAYIMLDSSGKPRLISPAARVLLAKGSGLRLLDGHLHADVARENLRLYSLLATACVAVRETLKSGVGETAMTITRTGLKPLQIALQPLHTACEASCAVLFLRDPEAQPASRAGVLRQMYSLLPSEVRLAESLTDGLDVKHAALRMHITENSARTLLKGVFRKLEVNSQAGLIRTVLTLPAE